MSLADLERAASDAIRAAATDPTAEAARDVAVEAYAAAWRAAQPPLDVALARLGERLFTPNSAATTRMEERR